MAEQPKALNKIEYGSKGRRYSHVLSVACSGPREGVVEVREDGLEMRSRDGARLRFTTADVDYLSSHFSFSPPMPSATTSHSLLVEPERKDLRRELERAGELLSSRVEEADWAGGNMVLAFAGHGREGDGALVLTDGYLDAVELYELIAASVTPNRRRCRLDIVLDSCFSAAFVAQLLAYAWNHPHDRIFPSTLLAAALHDERAWEIPRFGHGAFTYSYKKGGEFGLRHLEKPPTPEEREIWEHTLSGGLYGPGEKSKLDYGKCGVTYLTGGQQHPIACENGHIQVFGRGSLEIRGKVGSVSSQRIVEALGRARQAKWNEEVPL